MEVHGLSGISRGKRYCLLFLLVAVSLPLLAREDWQQETLIICSEDAGWPPYSFVSPDENAKFSGFSHDLFERIFTAHGIEYLVEIKPWKRCLQEGIAGPVHLVLDAASNPQRARDYLLTEPIYSLKPVFFTAREHALAVQKNVSIDQLKSLIACGQKGYTYTNFGFDNSLVPRVSKDLPKLLDLVRLGRCDVGLGRDEILRAELKNYEWPDQFYISEIPDTALEPFYWMINRKFDFAPALKKHIDEQVQRIYQSGEAELLLNRYF
ncbi:MAG: hypothetical protein C9356_17205 [Oleiphilus sp.]|nr:MAG: hypothetical protein C9356_17205 [Oleiphilus sp.]